MTETEQSVQSKPLEVVDMTIKRILVVDDEATIREVVTICLKKLGGWDVLTAASGLNALQQARAELPDAIVLDIAMPEMDGLMFLRYLHADPSIQHIPVVLLTANSNLPAPGVLTDMGVVLTISKPFHSVELVQRIAQVMGWHCLAYDALQLE